MKKLLPFLLLFSTIMSFSQNVETCFFKRNDAGLMFFLDEIGDVTTSSSASYYRLALPYIYNGRLLYSGPANDYFLNNEKAWECTYIKGVLSGEVKSYYQNNQIKYRGFFSHALRDSTWTFFYKNGNVEKIVHFTNDIPFIKEFYRNNGKPVFVDGNGKYSSSIICEFKNTSSFKISGSIKNGKIDGRWQWSDTRMSGSDLFKDGNYIKSLTPGAQQMVSLIGFDLHENVDLLKFIAIPRNNTETQKDIKISGIPVNFSDTDFEKSSYFDLSNPNNQPLKYKNSVYLDKTLAPEISGSLLELVKANQVKKIWCFIQFVVNEKSLIENIVVQSNNDLITNKLTQLISNITGFEAVKSDAQYIKCDIYLCCFYDNDHLNFPDYNYNNQSFNINDLFQKMISR